MLKETNQDEKAFTEKKMVWIPDEKECFVAGKIVDEKENSVVVERTNGQKVIVSKNDIQKMNPPKFDFSDDLAALSHLNEASVLYNLKKRYFDNLIYTFSGLFLVAMNPYNNLKIYGEEIMRSYRLKKKYDLPPHIFTIANESYVQLVENRENQSILITGESGAGKTVNTKRVIQFLTYAAGGHEETTVEQMIMATNPILESFGNAKTIKNDNSSRFGKFIQIKFDNGTIIGASIEKYLLEKSRVTRQVKGERNYHIFYQLIKGASAEIKEEIMLKGSLKDYKYLKDTTFEINGVDDVEEFKNLEEAFEVLKFTKQQRIEIYKILSAILNLGNLEFTENNDQAEIKDIAPAQAFCELLSIPLTEFIKILLHPVTKAGHELVVNQRTMKQAYDVVEALARVTYENLFDYIIAGINNAVDNPQDDIKYIGILDIAGFEIFKSNGFEQFCINYTNEKLQQFFNHHMFILEQEVYKTENIDWNFIDFGLDLQPTIDLIEKTSPIGILSYLDEECVMPRANDKTFIEKLKLNLPKQFKNTKVFSELKFKQGFTLKHYAGLVEYEVEDWTLKNRDTFFDSFTVLLSSGSELISTIYSKGGSGSQVKKGYFRTVSQRHKEQLYSLMKMLQNTNPHFVRCILPNSKKMAYTYEGEMILNQLRCNGVLEGIRISRLGFPSRIEFAEFVKRYCFLVDVKFDLCEAKSTAGKILEKLNLDKSQYRIGNTKLFFKQGVLAEIEDIREAKRLNIARSMKYYITGLLKHKEQNIETEREKAIMILQKNAKISIAFRAWKWWKLYLKIKPLLDVSRANEEKKQQDDAMKKLEQTLEDEKRRNEELMNEIKKLKCDKNKIEKELSDNEGLLSEKESILMELRIKKEEIERANAEMESRLLKSEEKIKKINEEIKRCNEELDKSNSANKQLKEKLDTVEEQNNNNVSKLQDLEKKIKKSNEELEKNKEKVIVLEAELKASKSNNSNVENEVVEKEKILAELKINLDNMKKDKQSLVDDGEKLKKKIKELEKTVENKTREIEDISADSNKNNETNKNKIKMLTDDIEQLSKVKEEKEKLEKTNRKIEEEKTDMAEKIKMLKNDQEDLSVELERKGEEFRVAERKIKDLELKNSRDTELIGMEQIKSKNLENKINELTKANSELQEDLENKTKQIKLEGNQKLADKISALEKKNLELKNSLKDEKEYSEQLTKDREEFHKQNMEAVQQKLNDIFQKESEMKSEKNKMNFAMKKLEAENESLKKSLQDKISQEDSSNANDELMNALEDEKRRRDDLRKQLLKQENDNLELKNQLERNKIESKSELEQKDHKIEILEDKIKANETYSEKNKLYKTQLKEQKDLILGLKLENDKMSSNQKDQYDKLIRDLEKEKIDAVNSKEKLEMDIKLKTRLLDNQENRIKELAKRENFNKSEVEKLN
ncbi:Myosin heavy chain, partial [Spraguea lophii 42_110]